MTKSRQLVLPAQPCIATGVSLCCPRCIQPATPHGTSSPTNIFDQAYFPYQPTAGTLAGFHQYDTQLEDSTTAPRLRSRRLRCTPSSVKSLPFPNVASMNGQPRRPPAGPQHHPQRLLTLETIQPWEKNPDNYSTGIYRQRLFSDGAQVRAAR